jgi:MFS family permease
LFSQYRSIPDQAKLLIALNFIPGLALGFIYTDLSYFLTSVRGLSIPFTSLVITVMGLTVVGTSIPFGILADRYGRRKFVIVGNLLASITLASFALTATPALLVLAAVVEGSTEAAFASAGTALLAEKAGEAHRTTAFSLSAFLSSIGWGLSGFAIPLVLVLESFGLNNLQAHVTLYLVLAASSVAVTPLLFRIEESRTSAKAKNIREFLPRKSRGVMVKYAVTVVLIAFGAGLFNPLMTLWFKLAFGVPDTVSGPVIGLSGFLIAAFTLGAPNLARRFGLVKSIVLTQGLSMVFMIAVPIAPTFAAAGGVYVIRTFIMNVAGPLGTSLIMGLVDADERGAASGINAAITRFPNSISTVIGGAMMREGMLALPFYIASVLYSVSICLFWFFFRKAKLPEETEQHL